MDYKGFRSRRILGALTMSILAALEISCARADVADKTWLKTINLPIDYPLVRTLAGSGAPGIRDGAGSQATFMAPMGLAFGPGGVIYVADRDAQRIRAISRSGVVSTLAGSGAPTLFGLGVAGGFRNGAAKQARFNMPMGVAVTLSGIVYVADSMNHCIRVISNGTVRTLAGSPLVVGSKDGSGAAAQFNDPLSIALGSDGDIYVADYPNGVRRVTPSGVVSTLPLGPDIVAVTTAVDAYNKTLIAVGGNQIIFYWLDLQKEYGRIDVEASLSEVGSFEGGKFTGIPGSLAAFSPNELVYTDALNSTIRLLQFDVRMGLRPLSAWPLETASGEGGSLRDGPGENALFSSPMGVAISPNQEIAVADTGNRRIRMLSLFNRLSTSLLSGGDIPEAEFAQSADDRIALVGNSYVWFGDAWFSTLPGQLQQILRSSGAGSSISIIPIRRNGIALRAQIALAQKEVESGKFDRIVFQLTGVDGIAKSSDAADIVSSLAALRSEATARHVRLLAFMHPIAWEVPGSVPYLRELQLAGLDKSNMPDPTDPEVVRLGYENLKGALAASGLPYVDLWPIVLDSRAPYGGPSCFGPWDHHFGIACSDAIAGALSKAIKNDLLENP